MHFTLYDVLDFLVVTVFFKVIIVHWTADRVLDVFKYLVVRTKRQAVYWVHFREKALGHCHQYPTPEVCQDGICKTFHKDVTK